MSTTLYRLTDAGGRLLYVGISNGTTRRLGQHHNDKPWWPQVAAATFEHYATRDAALEAERDAIRTEQPLHNVVHNTRRPPTTAHGDPKSWRQPYDYSCAGYTEFHDLAWAIDRLIKARNPRHGMSWDELTAAVIEATTALEITHVCRRCRSNDEWVQNVPIRHDADGRCLYRCSTCGQYDVVFHNPERGLI